MIPDLAGTRILVVEDETLLALDLEMLLAQSGCEVVGPVATVAAAIAAVDGELLDAALLDLNLQGESAVPIADALVARSIPFVFLSGYDRSHLPERHRDAPLVAKPYLPDHVLQLLRKLIKIDGLPA